MREGRILLLCAQLTTVTSGGETHLSQSRKPHIDTSVRWLLFKVNFLHNGYPEVTHRRYPTEKGTVPWVRTERIAPARLRSQTLTAEQDQPPWKPPRFAQENTAFQTNWETFHKFTTRAQIAAFGAAQLPCPAPKASYNGDAKLQHFQSSKTHYVGKQRLGEVVEHWEFLSLRGHTAKALSSPFTLSLHTPLPGCMVDAALFISDYPPNSEISFWNAQLNSRVGHSQRCYSH